LDARAGVQISLPVFVSVLANAAIEMVRKNSPLQSAPPRLTMPQQTTFVNPGRIDDHRLQISCRVRVKRNCLVVAGDVHHPAHQALRFFSVAAVEAIGPAGTSRFTVCRSICFSVSALLA
jgi:hypothetical protein